MTNNSDDVWKDTVVGVFTNNCRQGICELYAETVFVAWVGTSLLRSFRSSSKREFSKL